MTAGEKEAMVRLEAAERWIKHAQHGACTVHEAIEAVSLLATAAELELRAPAA